MTQTLHRFPGVTIHRLKPTDRRCLKAIAQNAPKTPPQYTGLLGLIINLKTKGE